MMYNQYLQTAARISQQWTDLYMQWLEFYRKCVDTWYQMAIPWLNLK